MDLIYNKFDEKNSHTSVCIQSLPISKTIFHAIYDKSTVILTNTVGIFCFIHCLGLYWKTEAFSGVNAPHSTKSTHSNFLNCNLSWSLIFQLPAPLLLSSILRLARLKRRYAIITDWWNRESLLRVFVIKYSVRHLPFKFKQFLSNLMSWEWNYAIMQLIKFLIIRLNLTRLTNMV